MRSRRHCQPITSRREDPTRHRPEHRHHRPLRPDLLIEVRGYRRVDDPEGIIRAHARQHDRLDLVLDQPVHGLAQLDHVGLAEFRVQVGLAGLGVLDGPRAQVPVGSLDHEVRPSGRHHRVLPDDRQRHDAGASFLLHGPYLRVHVPHAVCDRRHVVRVVDIPAALRRIPLLREQHRQQLLLLDEASQEPSRRQELEILFLVAAARRAEPGQRGEAAELPECARQDAAHVVALDRDNDDLGPRTLAS